ncbi:MAG: hypothetical protein AAF226_14765 [Verrucomicrobiota bacterium]
MIGTGLPSSKKKFFNFQKPLSSSLTIVAIIAALVLAIGAYLTFDNYRWNGAISALKAAPGIEVMAVQRIGPFSKRITGLRDVHPDAQNPEDILVANNIHPSSADLHFVDYHSLNTPFQEKRNQKFEERLDQLSKLIGDTVGELSQTQKTQRQSDLSKISQLLLELKYPEMMDRIKVENRQGSWRAIGDVTTADIELLTGEAAQYLMGGVVDPRSLAGQ